MDSKEEKKENNIVEPISKDFLIGIPKSGKPWKKKSKKSY